VSKQGFQLETHFGTSDSAVKLSSLAGRLEEPSRLFICRHWHCDSRSIQRRRNFISACEERRQFPLALVEGLGVSSELGAIFIQWLGVFHFGWSIHLPSMAIVLAVSSYSCGCVFSCAGSVLFPRGRVLPCWSCFSPKELRVLVAAWEANVWRLLVDLPIVAVHCIAEKVIVGLGLPSHSEQTANDHCMGHPLYQLVGDSFGSFLCGCES
jgi:hypothetical protein